MPEPATSSRARVAGTIVPLAIAAFAFAPGLAGGFTEDDPLALLRHPAVNGRASILAAFTRTFWGTTPDVPPPSYRPLATLSFALDHALVGFRPAPMHLASLAYYLLMVHLAQRLAQRFMTARAALIAAIAFAVLPVHVENVASLVGRADVLALCFSLIAWLAVIPRARAEMPGAARIAGGVVATFAALLCKESAVSVPVVALLLSDAASPDARASVRAFARRHTGAWALFAAVIAYAIFRRLFMPATFGGYVAPDDVMAGAPLALKVTHAFELLVQYAQIIALPSNLCTGRKYAMFARPDGVFTATALGGLALFVLIVVVSIRDVRAARPPWLLAAFASWVLFSGLVVPLPEAMADRFALAPSLFVVCAIASVLDRWTARSTARAVLAGALAGLFALASAFYATRWHDDHTLFAHAVTACPDSVHDHLRLADVLAREGAHDEAAWHYAVAAEGRRHFPRAWHHPAADEEDTMPVRERLARAHALLHVEVPAPVWRAAMVRFLIARGRVEEAATFGDASSRRQ